LSPDNQLAEIFTCLRVSTTADQESEACLYFIELINEPFLCPIDIVGMTAYKESDLLELKKIFAYDQSKLAILEEQRKLAEQARRPNVARKTVSTSLIVVDDRPVATEA